MVFLEFSKQGVFVVKSLFGTYLATGFGICLGFGVSAYAGWRLPKFDFSSGSNSYIGRSTGGSWGGGK